MAVRRTSVAVQMFGQEFRIRSGGDPGRVRRAAGLVDETMQRVRARTQTPDTLDVALLAALNLAHRLLLAREGEGGPRTSGELAPLIELVESALAEEAAAG